MATVTRSSQLLPEDIINELKMQLQSQQDELVRLRNESVERVYNLVSFIFNR